MLECRPSETGIASPRQVIDAFDLMETAALILVARWPTAHQVQDPAAIARSFLQPDGPLCACPVGILLPGSQATEETWTDPSPRLQRYGTVRCSDYLPIAPLSAVADCACPWAGGDRTRTGLLQLAPAN